MKTNFQTLETAIQQELIQHAIEGLKDRGAGMYGCDVHNTLFNEDYWIIGSYKAELWLEEAGGVFNAIGVIKEYEESNFGEVNTDLSEAERVCNMFVYIVGEEMLGELETLRERWNEDLSEEDVNAIIEELENL